MANAQFEEVIRLAFETGGVEGITQAAQAFVQLGDVSQEARADAVALLNAISSTEKTGKALETYREVGKSVLEYQRNVAAATDKVQTLAAAIAASDQPTKAQTRELDRARAGLRALVAEQQGQVTKLRETKATLDASGVSLRSFTAAQRELKSRTDAATDSFRAMVTRLKAQRDLEADLRTEQARGARQAAEFAAAVDRVRKAQERNGAAGREGAQAVSEGLERTRSAAERLRGVLAGLGAFFSFAALLQGVKSLLSTGDDFARFEKQLSSLYGSQAKGQQAFEWVKAFSKETPLQLQDVMKSFITLKNFGIDPMNGSLRAIIDQNARLGGETERLERITLALGQAFAKGKLQGEEMRQLVEAGVPVYQILGEVTGKTAGELQKLGETGKLGLSVLQKFVAQMGKDSLGAAAAQVETLGGQVTVAKDNFQQFQDQVAKSGALDYFREQLKSLNATIRQMTSDGRLAEYARRISDGIVTVAKAVQSAGGFLIDHAAAIGAVAKAYAAFRIGSIVGEIGLATARFAELAAGAIRSQGAVGGVAAKATLLTKVLRSLPPTVQVAIAVAGFELLVQAGDYIGELAGKHSAAAKNLEAVQKRVRDEMERQADTYRVVQQQYIQYADTQILTAKQVAALSAKERASYETRLEGLQAYLKAKQAEQVRLQSLGRDVAEELGQTRAAYQTTKDGMAALAEGARIAEAALKDHLSAGAEALRASLVGVGDDATTASTRIQQLFATFQSASTTDLGDLALALANTADQSQRADLAVRLGLKATLDELTSTDLLRFQSAATAAFNTYQVSATDAAAVTQTVLEVALARLGVAADRWGLATTDASRQNVAAFATVAENAAAAASTIEAAFNKALASATTVDEVKSLGDALYVAGDQGKVGFEATERAAAAVQNRLRQLQTALDPLTDSFAALGIQSKRALDDAAAAARSAFATVVESARAGKATVDDVRAAFAAMSRAQLDAVANSEPWQQATVQAALKTQAAVLNVTAGLDRMGNTGLDAGDRVARGAGHARDALDDTASATHRAADATERASETTDDAAESETHYSKAADESAKATRRHAKETEALSYSLGGLSDQLVKDLANLNQWAGMPDVWRHMWNDVMQQATDQLNQFKEQMATLDQQNAKFDAMSQRVAALRNQYKYLTEDQVRALAQAQQTHEENIKHAADEAKRRQEEIRRAAQERSQQAAEDNRAMEEQWARPEGTTADVAAPTPADGGRLALDLTITNGQRGSGTPLVMAPTDIQRLANLLVPAVVKQLGIRRATTNR